MNIPTVQQLHEAFGQNVTLNEWRRGPDGGYDGLKYEGTQKQLFDLLLKMVHQAEKRRAADVAKLKTKHELRIASIFRAAPEDFLRMIVVHELAHLLAQHRHDGGHLPVGQRHA